jgi:prepilin-type N-terminal cleavage/methylation domain-containing protein
LRHNGTHLALYTLGMKSMKNMRNKNLRNGRRGNESGFTAPELLIAVLVAAILIAAATPFLLGTIKNYRLRGAAWQVAGDLRLARQKSVASGRPYRFTFNHNGAGSDRNSYIIERQEVGGSWTMDPTNRIYLQQSGGPAYVMIDSTSTPPGCVIGLYANGTVVPSGTIKLVDNRGKEYDVAVNSVGRVNVTKI